MSGVCRFGAWVVALPVMVAFALHGALLTAAERPSCGCLGRISVPPWYTTAFDVVMVGLLTRCRPG